MMFQYKIFAQFNRFASQNRRRPGRIVGERYQIRYIIAAQSLDNMVFTEFYEKIKSVINEGW